LFAQRGCDSRICDREGTFYPSRQTSTRPNAVVKVSDMIIDDPNFFVNLKEKIEAVKI
jgi:hypothetical protein